jgi:hypothetical protein
MAVMGLVSAAHADVCQSVVVHKFSLVAGHGDVVNSWMCMSFPNSFPRDATHCIAANEGEWTSVRCLWGLR